MTMTSEWYPLVRYGDHPHPRGLQRITRVDADALVHRFHSLRGRLWRAFSGLPVYVGHPDDPAFAGTPGHSDTRAHGWIKAMEAREEALYVRINWSDTGRELMRNAHYQHLSPRWEARPGGPGLYVPVRLISVGLTNQPNILGDALSNARDHLQGVLSQVRERLEIDADVSDDQLAAAAQTRVEEEREQADGLYRAADAARAEVEQLRAQVEVLEAGLEAEREAHSATLVQHAVDAGLLMANDATTWHERFLDDFEATRTALTALRAPLPSGLRAIDLASRSRSETPSREAVLSLVNERSKSTGEAFAVAWQELKRSHPEWYAES